MDAGLCFWRKLMLAIGCRFGGPEDFWTEAIFTREFLAAPGSAFLGAVLAADGVAFDFAIYIAPSGLRE